MNRIPNLNIFKYIDSEYSFHFIILLIEIYILLIEIGK